MKKGSWARENRIPGQGNKGNRENRAGQSGNSRKGKRIIGQGKSEKKAKLRTVK